MQLRPACSRGMVSVQLERNSRAAREALEVRVQRTAEEIQAAKREAQKRQEQPGGNVPLLARVGRQAPHPMPQPAGSASASCWAERRHWVADGVLDESAQAITLATSSAVLTG